MDIDRMPAMGWIAAGALLASVTIAAWLTLRSDDGGLESIMTVDAAGDTLVYSGAVRDAIARARIVEAFNSVAIIESDSDALETAPPASGDSTRRADAARSAREAAVDALARLYTDPVSPETLLEALDLAILDFYPGTSTLPPDALAFLRAAAEAIGRAPDTIVVVIEGHASGGMDSEDDRLLGEARARAVAGVMIASGVDDERVRARGASSGSGLEPDERRTEGGHIRFSLARRETDEEGDEEGQPSAASPAPSTADSAADATSLSSDPGSEPSS